MADYREFLRSLDKASGRLTLFEPFPSKQLVSQILWRAGSSLWDTVEHRVKTLISFYDYIRSDTAVIAAKDDIEQILGCAHMLPVGMSFVILSSDTAVLEAADRDASVCALASCKPLDCRRFNKPLICISNGEATDIEAAISHGASGVYVPGGIEALWEQYRSSITLIGGISDSIASSAPAKIHKRIRQLYDTTHGSAYILGSGSLGGEVDYLGFISMLHMYNTLS